MTDHKPPRGADGERATLLALWQFQRESLVRKLDGVTEADADRALVPSGTTLRWLAAHMADAELIWFVERFAAQPRDDGELPTTMAGLIDRYRATWARTDAIIAAHDLDDPCAGPHDDVPTNLRWVIAHLLEETARHAGHADILRELIDGSAGR